MQFISNSLRLFSTKCPSPANAVEIFQEGWASTLPSIGGTEFQTGPADLFDDARIHWAEKQIGGFKGMKVLELGPLEGGHSYMLQALGADSILAIEANSQHFLKCLVVKELYKLDKCSFLLGDFVKYMEQSTEVFDFCLASGVLYHMTQPAELLALIAKVSKNAMIWTQYYDPEIIGKRMPYLKRSRFSRGEKGNLRGFIYSRYRRQYGILGLRTLKFWGGSANHSYWLE